MPPIAVLRPHRVTALAAVLLGALVAAAPATALTTGPRVVGVPATTTIDQVPWQVAPPPASRAARVASAPATVLRSGPRVVGCPATTAIAQVPRQVAVHAAAPGR